MLDMKAFGAKDIRYYRNKRALNIRCQPLKFGVVCPALCRRHAQRPYSHLMCVRAAGLSLEGLTLEEWDAVLQAEAEAAFDEIDADHGGKLTPRHARGDQFHGQ